MMDDPGKRELLARCVEAASRSFDDWKIDVLAQVFVAAAEDGAKVEQGTLLVDALRQIDGLHARLLRILARPGPKKLPASGTPDGALGLGALATGGPDVWPVEEILAEDPDLRGAFDYLVGRLTQLGMIYDEAPARYGGGRGDWRLTDFGRACATYLMQRAQGAPG